MPSISSRGIYCLAFEYLGTHYEYNTWKTKTNNEVWASIHKLKLSFICQVINDKAN